MKNVRNPDIRLKAEVYFALINDMQARIFEFESAKPDCINQTLMDINRQLSDARMEARIKVDDEHFQKWDELLSSADAAMI